MARCEFFDQLIFAYYFLHTTRFTAALKHVAHMHHYHIVRFRHRTIIEMPEREATRTQEERLETHRELETVLPLAEAEMRRLATVRSPAGAGPALDSRYEDNHWAGWYGVEADEPVPVSGCARNGDWTTIRIGGNGCCCVRTEDITVEDYDSFRAKSDQALFVPVPLANGTLAGALLDPTRSFFRRPEEAGFWEQIVTDCFDATARLVYADWLDDHGDPHAWVLREPMPFAHGYLRTDWVGAWRQVGYHLISFVRTLWEFAGVSCLERDIWFTLADGTPVPQFVAYLLAVSRIRAEQRLSDADLKRLGEIVERVEVKDDLQSFSPDGRPMLDIRYMVKFDPWRPAIAGAYTPNCITTKLGNTHLWLEGDLLIGPDDELVCRLTDPEKLASQVEQPPQTNPPSAADLAAQLRAANSETAIAQTARVEYPFPPGVPGPVLHFGTDLDTQTRVGNERAFDLVLNAALRRTAQERCPLSVLAVELDYLGMISKLHGDEVGDRVRVEFTRRALRVLGQKGFLARTGTDVFGVVLPAADLTAAERVAEELRRSVEEWRCVADDGAPLKWPVTISVGAASFDPAAADDRQFVHDAFVALERAKREGRNRVCS